MSYAIHPLAMAIPAMTDEEYRELREDIAKHGLVEPITLHEHMVLDGRHRLRACEETGTEPRFEEFSGGSPAEYVMSKNLRRRHLTPSQRAAIAVAFLPALEKEAAERSRVLGRELGGRPPVSPDTGGPKPKEYWDQARAAVKAGEQIGVSGSTVARAKRVQTEDPEMFEKVKSGEVTVFGAVKELRHRSTPNSGMPERTVNPIKRRRIPSADIVVPKVLAALRVQSEELERAVKDGTMSEGMAAEWTRDLSPIVSSLRATTNYLKGHS